MTTQPHFDTALFAFLTALRSNNNREWFHAHKQRYEREVRDPMLRFIGDVRPHLWQISPRIVADARPNGHSCFASSAMCASRQTSVPTRRTLEPIFVTKQGAMCMPRAFTCTSSLGECLSPVVCGILTGTHSPRFVTPLWRIRSTGSASSRQRPSAPLVPLTVTRSHATRAGMTRRIRFW